MGGRFILTAPVMEFTDHWLVGSLKNNFAKEITLAFQSLDDRDEVFGGNIEGVQRIGQTLQFCIAGGIVLSANGNKVVSPPPLRCGDFGA